MTFSKIARRQRTHRTAKGRIFCLDTLRKIVSELSSRCFREAPARHRLRPARVRLQLRDAGHRRGQNEGSQQRHFLHPIPVRHRPLAGIGYPGLPGLRPWNYDDCHFQQTLTGLLSRIGEHAFVCLYDNSTFLSHGGDPGTDIVERGPDIATHIVPLPLGTTVTPL
jgi:hypothetical protein